MKLSKKVVGLIIALLCVAGITTLILSTLYHQPPSLSLVRPLENSKLLNARSLEIPSNQSTIILEAEQASFIRNENEVNVTVLQTANESTAHLLFEIAKTSYLAQGLIQKNITISGFDGAEFYTSDRPYIILLVKEHLLIQSSSINENLAIEAIKTQVES